MSFTISATIIYILSCVFVKTCYVICHNYLLQYSQNYKILKPTKQTYVVANLVKSIILCFLIPCCINFISKLNGHLILEDYQSTIVAASIYGSTDMVSLIYENGKKMSTTFHHILVQLTVYACLYLGPFHILTDIILTYGCFSALAYQVNFYLAARFLINNKKIISTLATLAFVIYVVVAFSNWIIQTLFAYNFFYNANYITLISHILMNYIFINDDIILMRFLYDNSYMGDNPTYKATESHTKEN